MDGEHILDNKVHKIVNPVRTVPSDYFQASFMRQKFTMHNDPPEARGAYISAGVAFAVALLVWAIF